MFNKERHLTYKYNTNIQIMIKIIYTVQPHASVFLCLCNVLHRRATTTNNTNATHVKTTIMIMCA